MKKFYLVIGPESSGNRLLTRIIASCGIVGDGSHDQRLDDLAFRKKIIKEGKDAVLLRSLPHAHKWPDLLDEIIDFKNANYQIKVMILMRDWACITQSQVSVGHVDNLEDAVKNIKNAYYSAINQVVKYSLPFCFVSYESMIYEKDFPKRFCRDCDLGIPNFNEEIRNENAKWIT